MGKLVITRPRRDPTRFLGIQKKRNGTEIPRDSNKRMIGALGMPRDSKQGTTGQFQ